jgi:peroxisomal 3,2-trans-enoyl-CoA isomerase
MSKKITSEELVQTGFVTKIFSRNDENDHENFLEQVLAEVEDKLGQHLNQDSLLKIKEIIRKPYHDRLESQGVIEVMEGMQRLLGGAPQVEFKKIVNGQKKYKL